MNNTNPFIPQGSVLEQNKRRSRVKLAVFCVLAVSVCGLTAMLIEGCKREQTEENTSQQFTDTNTAPETDTNVPPATDTNASAMTPPESTNVAPVVPAVAPVAPPVVPETTESDYVIVKGDTLGKIAKAHGVSLKALEAANPNVQPTRLKVGQKIALPSGGGTGMSATSTTSADTTGAGGEEVYVVKSGDTLTRIARSHGTTVKAIEAENGLSTTKIKVGQKLKIPSAATAAAPAPAAPAASEPPQVAAPQSTATAPSTQ